MMARTVPVRFEPSGAVVWAASGETILQAARRAGVAIDAPCGGRGVCGGCGVRVEKGAAAPPDEYELVGLRRAPSGVRLACRARIEGPLTVRPVVHHPVHAAVSTEVARGGIPVGASSEPLVAAVDLGTSTVAAVIIRRESRVEVGRGVVSNRQSAWGADVVSRVMAGTLADASLAGPAGTVEGAQALREAAETSVLEALSAACLDEGLCLGAIERLVIAGNSAMAGLLVGADVSGLAAHPFEAPKYALGSLPADSAIFEALATAAEARVLPPMAAFVGGDVAAGIVAEGLGQAHGALLIDLGTNAEVVHAKDGTFTLASAAAGPAFEGGGISCGGPAAEGAVERATFDAQGGLELDVIGGGEAQWVCGSGLISIVALLRRLGHVNEEGLMIPDGPLTDRMSVEEGVRTFRVSPSASASNLFASTEDGCRVVTVNQHDVRALQLAKAAVRSAIDTVLTCAFGKGRGESSAADVSDVIIAGGLGSALEIVDLGDLGLIPSEFVRRARTAGNTSLLGAAMIAVDPALEREIMGLAGHVRHVELALQEGFTDRYVSALGLAPYSLGRS